MDQTAPTPGPAGLLAALLAGSLAAQAAPIVATHYFYWYRWPDEHFDEPGAPGPEGHCHHFPAPERVSYRSAAWHEEQLAAMAACGIDCALPVYWGAPGAYDRPGIAFSVQGLPPMVEALEALRRRRRPSVKLGLFYDTTTLLNAVRGASPHDGRADLTTGDGKALFTGTVVDYFARIPEPHWARAQGRALVVLYGAAFARAHDATLGPALRAAFAARFPGQDVFLVADASWGEIGQDRTTYWGAALAGPRLYPGVAQIGPGYDDSAVPGRRTPVREREDGAFYRWSWQQALAAKPALVLLETWNEMHEGTEICATRETGSLYLDLTREHTRLLRQGGAAGPPIELRWPEPRPRPDRSFGDEAAAAPRVRADWRSGERFGLREVAHEDGPLTIDGALRSTDASAQRPRYLYLQVADAWRFDADQDLVLELRRRGGAVGVEYDSRDAGATLAGAYTLAERIAQRSEGDVTVERFALPRARLANRQNAGADLRLLVHGTDTAVLAATLQPRQ